MWQITNAAAITAATAIASAACSATAAHNKLQALIQCICSLR